MNINIDININPCCWGARIHPSLSLYVARVKFNKIIKGPGISFQSPALSQNIEEIFVIHHSF